MQRNAENNKNKAFNSCCNSLRFSASLRLCVVVPFAACVVMLLGEPFYLFGKPAPDRLDLEMVAAVYWLNQFAALQASQRLQQRFMRAKRTRQGGRISRLSPTLGQAT